MRRRLRQALALAASFGILALFLAGGGGVGHSQAQGTGPPTDIRSAARAVLDSHASLLSTATRVSLGMLARGDRLLTPGNPTRPDTVARSRPKLPATAGNSAARGSDAGAAAPSTNVLVNAPGEDVHEVDQTTQSETSIAVSGQHVAVGFNDSQTGLLALTAGDDITGYAYSDNGGATFTDGAQLPNALGYVNLGDPWLATDPNGAMYYSNLALGAFGFTLGVAVAKSLDGGHTWSTPVIASPSSAFYQADKDALAAGVGPNHSGTALYDAWDDITFPPFAGRNGGGGGGGGVAFGLAVSHSYDGGQTWHVTYADQISNSTGCNFGQYIGALPQVDGSTGTLYVVAERIDVIDPTCGQQPPTITFSQRLFVSSDGGNTFNPGVVVATIHPVPSPFILGPASQMRDAEFPTLALRNGTIYVAWNDGGGAGGSSQIRLAHSKDGGHTWSTTFVTSGAGQRLQPALSGDASGLHLLYYRINTDLTLDTIAADSTNGTTWTAQQINTVSFPGVENSPQFDPLVVDSYMGDYIANVSDGSHRYYAWGDNRNIVTNFLWPQGRHDPDVYFGRN